MACNGRIPETRDGDAVQERAQDNPSAVDCNKGSHGPAYNAHLSGREDMGVLYGDGSFGCDHGGVVEWVTEPEELTLSD